MKARQAKSRSRCVLGREERPASTKVLRQEDGRLMPRGDKWQKRSKRWCVGGHKKVSIMFREGQKWEVS